MKKIFLIIRNAFIFIAWTIIFTSISNLLVKLIWNFDFTSAVSWQILSDFWNHGGIIKTTSDILLITTLMLLPPLWLVGFILSLKLNYFKIITFPIKYIAKIFDTDKNKEPERIVIKNIKSSQQMIDDIKNELDSIKPEKSKEAGNIRFEVTKKREETKN